MNKAISQVWNVKSVRLLPIWKIHIFNLNFEIELDLTNVFEIYQYFGVFFNILSYWRSANKKLLDDIFDFDFDWEHNGLFGWFMDVCTKIWKLSAEHRNCLPRL